MEEGFGSQFSCLSYLFAIGGRKKMETFDKTFKMVDVSYRHYFQIEPILII